MCRIGVESLAYGRAQSAAVIFGFIHPIVRVRTIPARSAELSSVHAAASVAPRRNSLPSTHTRCKTTANLRAMAAPALGLHQPHAPAFQARPSDRAHQHGVRGCIKSCAYIGITSVGDATWVVGLAGLVSSRRQAKVSADGARLMMTLAVALKAPLESRIGSFTPKIFKRPRILSAATHQAQHRTRSLLPLPQNRDFRGSLALAGPPDYSCLRRRTTTSSVLAGTLSGNRKADLFGGDETRSCHSA